MSDKKIITIFGASGKQGGSVVDIFLRDPKLKDWSVRGVSRDASNKKLLDKGIEVVAADVNDKASLEKAMQGTYAVFAVTNYWDKMDADLEYQQGKNLADAAKATGVQHFIWSSLMNIKDLTKGKLTKVYHFDAKAKVEEYVRELGIPASFFMPGLYMSGFPGGMLRQNSPSEPWTLTMPVPQDTAKVPVFDPIDTGKWVKAIVLHRDELLGKRLLAGTRYMTPQELLEGFKEAFPEAGKTARYFEAPADGFVAALKGRGMPEFAAEELLQNMQLLNMEGYYGGASLDESHAFLDDELTPWSEHIKTSLAFKDLK